MFPVYKLNIKTRNKALPKTSKCYSICIIKQLELPEWDFKQEIVPFGNDI